MYINLALESGGIKGLVYVGVLKYLEERGYKIHKASGTSAGSIFACLAVCGFKVKEIKSIIDTIEIKSLANPNNMIETLKQKGINKIDGLEKILEEILAKKSIYTFQDLKFGEDFLLKVVVTDNKTKKMVVIPDDLSKYGYNKNNFKVAKAIAMSCSIPFFYAEYRFGKERFVDGGATYPFPLDLVVDNNHPIIGVRIVNNSTGFRNFINKGFHSIQSKIYKMVGNKKENLSNKIYLVDINVPKLGAAQFSKGLEKKEELYQIGYQEMKKYFCQNIK